MGESKLAAENYITARIHEGTRTRELEGTRTQQHDNVPQTRHCEDDEGGQSNLFIKPRTPGDQKVYILRPCMIHGPGNKGNLNLLYKLVQKGLPWPLGSFENKRSFTSIENLTYIINQLIVKDIEPGIYQVADDEAISTNEIIRLIAASQNKKSRIWNISKKLILLSARIGDTLHLPLNSERLKKLTESYVVSNQKLKSALGIERMPVSAEDGMKKTLESFEE